MTSDDPTPRPTSPTLPSSAANPPADARFGPYVRTERLGAGGMGEVWKAWDTELSRWVALKLLKGDDPDEIARFEREAKTAARLAHPNIAAIYQVGHDHGRHWIAMRLIPGRTLKSFPRADRPLLVRMIRDAARAVAYANSQGVVHRDLKPENLMATEDGQVFVLDFGLARATEGAALSRSGLAIGTPAYMAPEQARGERVDARADVYGLGATLYEVLTGRPPFEGSDALDVLMKVVEQDPGSPRLIDPSLDADLETITLLCLEKDPARRFRSAAELADDLDRWLAGEAISARPRSLAYRLSKRLAKRRGVIIALAAGLLIAAGVSAFVIPRWLRAERERARIQLFVPLEAELERLRMNVYRSDYAMTDDDRARYEAIIAKIRAMGPSAEGAYLIGRCHEARSEFRAADAAYAEALALDPDHVRTLLSRGRMGVTGALLRRMSRLEGATEDDLGRAGDAVAMVERAVAAAGPDQAMEADLARASLEALRLERPFDAAPLLEKWKGRPFVEEFSLIEIISHAGGKDQEPATRVLLRRLPSHPVALLLRASVLGEGPQRAQVIPLVDRALNIHPGFAEARVQKALALLELGRPREALEELDRAIGLDPELAIAWANRASAKTDLGELEAARADLDQALRLDPAMKLAVYNRGLLSRKLGRLEEAVADFTRVLDQAPRFVMARYERGRTKWELGDITGALEDYRGALEIHPRHVPTFVARSALHHKRGDAIAALEDADAAVRHDPTRGIALNARAVALLKLNRLEEALADLEKAVAAEPGNAGFLANRSRVLTRLRRFAPALADIDRAMELAPQRADLRLDRVEVLSDSGREAEALAEIEKILAAMPGEGRAWYERGRIAIRRGEWEEAVRVLSKAAELRPSDFIPRVAAARARNQAGDFEGAEADALRALTLAPNDAESHLQLAISKIGRTDYRGARPDLDRAIELDPALADARAYRGQVRRRLGDIEGALSDLNEAIRIDTANHNAYFNRAQIRLQRQDWEAAFADFSRCIEHEPTMPEAWFNRGNLHLQAGRAAEAVKDYDRAIALRKGWLPALLNRAAAKEDAGDLAGALADYETILKIAPANADTSEVVRKIAELKKRQ